MDDAWLNSHSVYGFATFIRFVFRQLFATLNSSEFCMLAANFLYNISFFYITTCILLDIK